MKTYTLKRVGAAGGGEAVFTCANLLGETVKVVDAEEFREFCVVQVKAEVRLRHWIDDLQSGMFINCVYCGHRYGPRESTPVSMADVLKEHVMRCPEHPLSKLNTENSELRAQLGGMQMTIRELTADLADAHLIAGEQNDGHVAANLRNTHLEEKIRDLEFRLDAYRIAESLAIARIQELTREIRGCNGELGCAAYKLIRPGEAF